MACIKYKSISIINRNKYKQLDDKIKENKKDNRISFMRFTMMYETLEKNKDKENIRVDVHIKRVEIEYNKAIVKMKEKTKEIKYDLY